MFDIKAQVFLGLTKIQKSGLTRFLQSLAKKCYGKLDYEAIYEKFEADELYYNEVGNPHFEWVINLLNEQAFIEDTKKHIRHCIKALELKEKQKPLLEKQKAYQKQQRKVVQEYKMSKQPPTKQQLGYYTKLCKKYNLEATDTNDCSKLDLKNMIGDIIEQCHEES